MYKIGDVVKVEYEGDVFKAIIVEDDENLCDRDSLGFVSYVVEPLGNHPITHSRYMRFGNHWTPLSKILGYDKVVIFTQIDDDLFTV